MVVVADASPVITLARIGELDLVRALFGTVLVPDQVHAEILAGPGGAELLGSATWLEQASVISVAELHIFEQSLDAGEAAAIALALERHADAVLMDERRGRRVAIERGLQVIGVLGVLVRARQQGLITSAAAMIGRLQAEAGSHLAPEVVAAALRAAGEEP